MLILILIPLLAGIITAFLRGENAKKIAFGFALTEFAVSLYYVANFNSTQGLQFVTNVPWIKTLGINFYVGVDGISILLVLLTTLLVPFIILSTWGKDYKNPATFSALILFMESALVGVFTAQDAFLYYLFWEAALIPVYFLAAIWGGENRIQVTFKFFIYTVFGSLFMLISLIYLYLQTPLPHTADIAAYTKLNLTPEVQSYLFWGLFIAFAIKMPIFPFHTWQPDTYTIAPTPATMLLSGIMLKMGIYSLFRWLLPIVPKGVEMWATPVIILAIIGIVYGAIIAIRQQDMKRLLAYSSFSHVGLMAAGVFCLNAQALQGALVQMLAHGINVVGLFYVVELIYQRTNSRQINELGGITQTTPILTVYFTILLLGSVALPLTNGFVGEFLLLSGLFQKNVWLAAVAGLTIIFGAVYMLRMFQGVMFGEKTEHTQNIKDLSLTENLVLLPLVILVFWIGMYPSTFLNLTEPAVQAMLKAITK
ncbi:MAG: NADH-quinone oxidoreductase subunit M [Bacteroidia bacterium]|nr:NADH-quinone oxidoreductase subunit M [Bacteroidia bacterium]MDW8300824.1 NADH-quinone oxidoreductase subunit M [Bacteroidia bacterium]